MEAIAGRLCRAERPSRALHGCCNRLANWDYRTARCALESIGAERGEALRQGVTWTQPDAVAAKGCTKKPSENP
jgi:hypothetical protein